MGHPDAARRVMTGFVFMLSEVEDGLVHTPHAEPVEA
jgi:hypothetical protein